MKKAPFGAFALVAASCVVATPSGAQTIAGNGHQVYIAKLSPMNTRVTGHKATAEAKATVSGDTLTISIKAQGVPPSMVHRAFPRLQGRPGDELPDRGSRRQP